MNTPAFAQALADSDIPLVLVGGDGAIAWSNRAANSFLGEQAGAKTLAELVEVGDLPQVIEAKGPATVRLTHRSRPGNAASAVTECVVIPLGGTGEKATFLLVLQRNSPEVLALFAREDFLATVAHDLKNPLGAIFSYADGLLDTAAGTGLSDHHRSIIARMRATALRSIDLVRNYQHLSQLRAGRLQSPTAPTDLNGVVSAVLEYCWRPEPNSPSLSLKLASPDAPVLVDRLALERVISNLMSNAVKYTPVGGAISIETARLSNGSKLVLSNTGAGIRREERDAIFTRFKRGSASSGTTGSGLGLYIVKSIVDTVGAKIEFESEPNERTTFTVIFPG
ncbi:MAG: hypothetical protein RL417_973 [Pseudomonadota bacterium]|jgi:signal transduction histidine kinase